MERKKKYHGGLKLLLALLSIMLLGLCSTSYASMSEGYLDYIITTFHDNYTYSNTTTLNNFKNYLNNITSQQKQVLLNKINTFMEEQGISNLQDRNIFCTGYIGSNYTIKFFITNNSAPGSSENLDFYKISWTEIRKYTSSSTDFIYQINVDVRSPETISTRIFSNNTSYTDIDISSSNTTISDSGTVLTSKCIATCGIPAGFQTVPLSNGSSTNTIACILQDVNGGYVEPTPDPEPSGDISSITGTITNTSGDVTGQIDLSGIEQGIGDINNNLNNIENKIPSSGDMQNVISGEVGKITNTLTESADDTIDNTNITSGDIYNSLGFEVAQDPYANFWFTLTNNLKIALLGSVRSIDITFRGQTYTISLDNYLVLPGWLILILAPITTCLTCWVLVRQWKIIINKLTSGNIDSLLKENSQEGISNLF